MTVGEVVDLSIDFFKELAWEPLLKGLLAKLFTAVPLLGWGPIGYVITFLVMKYGDQLYEAFKLLVEVKTIKFVNKALQKDYDTASLSLKIIAEQKGIASEDYKKARDVEKENLSKYVRFDIAR